MELVLISIEQLTCTVNDAVEKALDKYGIKSTKKEDDDEWWDLKKLIENDPEKRRPSTIYGYVRQNKIPHYKSGKKLTFRKSEFQKWQLSSKKYTKSEMGLIIDRKLISEK